ncbi:hypothetical protein [Streptomonospora litoralis]|uniref:Uncharacterized protein n=1 Tax=Streptomonospora litoralis TaxID=2498135 RepID=A0A4P6Q936_9ACTN|nr:hypothetical protein [Streptomonospora litoralis]QBI55557.1 hypothetical protein EKD16_18970 [Streptomonospora litoralis]
MSELSPSDAARTVLPRALIFAAVCVGLSALGHGMMSRHDPSPPAVGAGFLLVLAVVWPVARREQGLVALCGWMLWGQATLHLVFFAAQYSLGTGARGHGHPPPPPAGTPAGPVDAVGAGALADGGAGMVLSHIAAALASAWWLRRGESAAFALARTLRVLLSGLLVIAAPAAPPARGRCSAAAPVDEPRRAAPVTLRHTVVLRAPPRPAAA